MEEKNEYTLRIGPKLKEAIEKQKVKIKEVTMDCVNASDYEAGEIIATKLKDNNLL